jgi:TorA maturation chaperone TorD
LQVATDSVVLDAPLTEEDRARANFYALIARLLLAPPEPELVETLACADSLPCTQASALDDAWEKVIAAAAAMGSDAIQMEYAALFISTVTPLVNPYGSLYMAGAMMEHPLADLRADMESRGLRRRAGIGECEDHLGALCEAMHLFIAGEPAQRASLDAQRRFFERHIGPWYRTALGDLRSAAPANFYARVADLACAFLDIDREALDMAPAREPA